MVSLAAQQHSSTSSVGIRGEGGDHLFLELPNRPLFLARILLECLFHGSTYSDC